MDPTTLDRLGQIRQREILDAARYDRDARPLLDSLRTGFNPATSPRRI